MATTMVGSQAAATSPVVSSNRKADTSTDMWVVRGLMDFSARSLFALFYGSSSPSFEFDFVA